MSLIVCSGLRNTGWEELIPSLLAAGLQQTAGGLHAERVDRQGRREHSYVTGRAKDFLESISAQEAVTDGVMNKSRRGGLLQSPEVVDNFDLLPDVPDVYYLLFYTSPAQALHGLRNEDQVTKDMVEQQLEQWRHCTSKLLSLYRHGKSNCLLVSLNDARENWSGLLSHLENMCHLDLETHIPNEHTESIERKFFTYLSMLATKDMDELDELYQDIKLSSTAIGKLSELDAIENGIERQFPFQVWAPLAREARKLKEELQTAHQAHNQALDESRNLRAELAERHSSSELQQLQLAQLQEELEYLQQIQSQTLVEFEKQKTVLAERVSDSELQQLQVAQLQEELESCFTLSQKAKEQVLLQPLPSSSISIERLASASGITLVGTHCDEESRNLTLILDSLMLGDGRKYDRLRCKLVEKGGDSGLEFRENDEVSGGASYITWPEGSADEYGPCLEFLPGLEGAPRAEQQAILGRLTCSDSLLVRSVAHSLANTLSEGSVVVETELGAQDLLEWRRLAYALQDRLVFQEGWLSIDDAVLLEAKSEPDREYLSVELNNLLMGDSYFEQFRFKVAVQSLTGDSIFGEELVLEFRRQEDGRPPLQVWPPVERDEYGQILQIVVPLEADFGDIIGIGLLSSKDRLFVRLLLQKLHVICTKLSDSGFEIDREWDQWVALTLRLAELRENEVTHEPDATAMKPVRTWRGRAKRLLKRGPRA